MKIIGVTGTFASGKSTVTRAFCELGAYVVDHDRINHDILMKGRTGYNALLEEYGAIILDDDGALDRAKVAEIVFTSEAAVKRVESILHPLILDDELKIIEEYKAENKYDYIIVDSPLLFEAGRDSMCDYTVSVTADEDALIERACQKFGFDEDEVKRRVSLQMSLKEKSERADFVIENNSTIFDLYDKAKDLFTKIKTLHE
ncbi:dephospho-CoA kinase [Thermodesulfobacteriota bacterium]